MARSSCRLASWADRGKNPPEPNSRIHMRHRLRARMHAWGRQGRVVCALEVARGELVAEQAGRGAHGLLDDPAALRHARDQLEHAVAPRGRLLAVAARQEPGRRRRAHRACSGRKGAWHRYAQRLHQAMPQPDVADVAMAHMKRGGQSRDHEPPTLPPQPPPSPVAALLCRVQHQRRLACCTHAVMVKLTACKPQHGAGRLVWLQEHEKRTRGNKEQAWHGRS